MGKAQTKKTKPRTRVRPRELNLNEEMDRLLAKRRIFVFHDLDEPMAAKITEQVLMLEEDDPKRDIEIYINSFGGSAYSAMALHDLFRIVKPDIRTVVLGSAASAAAFVAASGTKGKRCAGKNTTFMYHQLSWEVDAKVKDMSVKTAEAVRLNDLMDRIFSEMTGQPLKKIQRDTEHDFWLDAEGAKKYGIIDVII